MASGVSRSSSSASQPLGLPTLLENHAEAATDGAPEERCAISSTSENVRLFPSDSKHSTDLSRIFVQDRGDSPEAMYQEICKVLEACKADIISIVSRAESTGQGQRKPTKDLPLLPKHEDPSADEDVKSILPFSTTSSCSPSFCSSARPRGLRSPNGCPSDVLSPALPRERLRAGKLRGTIIRNSRKLSPSACRPRLSTVVPEMNWQGDRQSSHSLGLAPPEAIVWKRRKHRSSRIWNSIARVDSMAVSGKDWRAHPMLGKVLRILTCLFIVFDIVLMTLEFDTKVQSAIAGAESNDSISMLSLCIAVFFSLELLLSILHERWRLGHGHMKWWRVLDILTVLSSWADFVQDLSRVGVSKCGKALRLLRIARLTERELPQFAKTMLCVARCSHVALPVLAVILSVFYLIGLIVMSGVQVYAYGPEPDAKVLENMKISYGSTMTTMVTLVEAFLELRSSAEWYLPLKEMNSIYLGAFLCCWFFVHTVMASVIIGEVSTTISKVRKPDTAELIVEAQAQQQEHADNLYAIVSSLGADVYGSLKQDGYDLLSDDPVWQGYLQMLGISDECAKRVFQALDDDDGVETREYAAAVLAVGGEAKQFDMLDVKMHVMQLIQDGQTSRKIANLSEPSTSKHS